MSIIISKCRGFIPCQDTTESEATDFFFILQVKIIYIKLFEELDGFNVGVHECFRDKRCQKATDGVKEW